MPEVAVPAAPPLSSLRRVELIHTGQWKISSGVWNASREDLVAAKAALDCPAVRRPVLKLGHSLGEQPLWEGNPTGAPAVGWVDNLALTNHGHTLVGDFVGMPGWLGDIAASAYPDRSVEGKYDFRCQLGHTHPFVLTGVALLGVTPPGVGTLKSLQDVGALYGVEASGRSGTSVVAHMRGRHDQSSHGRRYGPDGNPVRRLTRGGRRNAVRTLNRVLREIDDDEAANRPGMSGGPLVELVRSVRDGVEAGQFTPDQALQLLSSLVFRPDVASNARLSMALAEATGRLRGVQAAAWDEADHPRDDDGRFTEKGAFARTTLDLSRGSLDVDDIDGTGVRLGFDAEGGRIEATLATEDVDELIDVLDEGLDDGFEIDLGSVNLSRDDDEYYLALGDGWLTLAEGDLGRLSGTLDEARRPRVSVETVSGDLRVKLDSDGGVNLRLDPGLDTDVVEYDLGLDGVEELRDGLDELLDTEIPDAAAGGDLVSSFGLDAGVELSLYGSGVVSISWDTDTDREEIELSPDDVEPVRDALDRMLDESGDFIAASAGPAAVQVAAAADVRTGAMVALLPSEQDARRLAVDGGDASGQLHATVLFLGDADAYPLEARQAIVDAVRALAQVIPPGDADGMAIAAFNPDKPDKDTCIVLELGGEALEDVHGLTEQAVSDVAAEFGLRLPEQHSPYRPHVTLLYSDDLSNVPKLADRAGPVRMDRVRVAFAGENVDISLTGEGSDLEVDELTDDDMPVDTTVAAQVGGSDTALRRYWLAGAGARKIRWGTPGDWTRCVRATRRYLRDPKGYCAELHKTATGVWPGDRRNVGRASVRASAEEAITLPNPNPTVIHAAVSVDDVRTAFYRQAGERTWIREFHTSPQRLIVADDGSGSVVRVDFEIGDDGAISFAQPVPVRVEYVEQGTEAEQVAASRLVYASAAESRPDVEAADDHWRRQPRARDGKWTDGPGGGGGAPWSQRGQLTDIDRAQLRRSSAARRGRTSPAEGAPDVTGPVPPSGRTSRFGDPDRPSRRTARPTRTRGQRESVSDARARSEESDFAQMVDEENRQRQQRSQAQQARETEGLRERESQLGRNEGDLPQRDAYESILEEAEAVMRQRFGDRRRNPQMASQIDRLRDSIADGDHDGAYGAGTSLMEMLEPFVSQGEFPALRRPSARMRSRPVRASAADPQPETPAAEPGNPTTKEDDMPLSTEVYQRLGLAEDADETAVSAAVMAALDKADQAPDPNQVAAAAAENETLTQKVTLLQEQVTGLSRQIADDNAAKAAEVKASVIDEALTKGRITPADRDKWAERYDKAPDAVTDVLASIADGTAVPVTVQGKAGDPWDVAASEDNLPPEPAWLYGPNEPALAGKE